MKRLALFLVACFCYEISARSQVEWVNRTPDLSSVAFGHNTFVAVGENGVVWTSGDGSSWQQHVLDAGFSNLQVVFTGSQFMVFGRRLRGPGSDPLVSVSYDGTEWARIETRPSDWEPLFYLTSWCFDGGAILGAGTTWSWPDANGVLGVSTNGLDWLFHDLPAGSAATGIAFGNDRYVAVGSAAWSSSDFMSWTELASPASNGLSCIAFGGGQFVAAGPPGAIFVSTNGEDWDSISLALTNGLTAACYGSGVFVVVGESGALITSTNGRDWLVRNSGSANDLHGVALGAGRCVAVGKAQVISSSDLAQWTMPVFGPAGPMNAVIFAGGLFVAIGTPAEGNPAGANLWTSTNGIEWNQRYQSPTGALYGVAFGNHCFVVVGEAGLVLTSPDAMQWSPQSSTVSENLNAVAYGGSNFVAVGESGIILVSADAMHWTNMPPLTTNTLQAISYCNGLFFAMGDEALLPNSDGAYEADVNLLVSPDGLAWSKVNFGTNNYIQPRSLCFAGGTYVAVGICLSPNGLAGSCPYYGQIALTSQDGLTWTHQSGSIACGGGVAGITWGNGSFVAVGNGCFTSPDGVVWAERATDAFPSSWGGRPLWEGVVFGKDRFVAVGYYGIWTSLGSPRLFDGSVQSDGSYMFRVEAPAGETHIIQASTNLQVWTSLLAVKIPTNSFQVLDPNTRSSDRRFYRVVTQGSGH